jgi:AraC-like DNA-binding protein
VLIGPSTFRRLVQARALLASDECDLTVQAVADVVGLSRYHFIRQFGALYGVTPHQLRSGARIARAQHLLATGASVTDTCMAIGFSSLGSFSALFARRVGLPPTRYRRFVQVPRPFSPVLTPGCLGLLGQLPARNFREALRS